MKKIIAMFLTVIMIIAIVPSVFAETDNGSTVILYTNDVHCAIDDYPVLAAYRAELMAQGNTVITVDAGDAIQGEVIGALTEGEAIVDIMNNVGYDYAVPGNHEYDYGMETFLDLAKNKAEYNYISSNFYKLTSVKPVFKPYYIENISEDMQIAFVGITTPESVTKSTPEYFKDEYGNFIYGFPTFDMLDDVLCETVQKSVNKAIADGADIVVAVGHLGIEGISDGWKSTDVIAHTTGIDYFIDAHSHETIEGNSYKNKNGEDVLLTSTGTKFNNFGVMTITDDGEATTKLVSPDDINVDALSDEAKTAYNNVKAVVDGYNSEIAYLYDPIGTSEAKLTAYEENGQWLVRKAETNAGDFVTDAYRAVTGADVAICNGGGVRAEIEIGDVSRIDLMNMNPWNNEMCVIEVTGQQLVDVLEHGVRAYPDYSGGFFQVSGVTFDVEAWKASPVITDALGNFMGIDPSGERRIANVKIGGEPIVLDETYTLAGSSYVLTQGGDGLTMLDGSKIVSTDLPCDSEMIIEYFEETLSGVISAELYGNADGDGRITIYDTEPVEPDVPSEPDEPENDADDNENTDFFMDIISKIIDFFSRIIKFITGLFAK